MSNEYKQFFLITRRLDKDFLFTTTSVRDILPIYCSEAAKRLTAIFELNLYIKNKFKKSGHD